MTYEEIQQYLGKYGDMHFLPDCGEKVSYHGILFQDSKSSRYFVYDGGGIYPWTAQRGCLIEKITEFYIWDEHEERYGSRLRTQVFYVARSNDLEAIFEVEDDIYAH